MTLDDYKRLIRSASSKTEIDRITYSAFLEDEKALTGERTLYNEVVSIAVDKEFELDARKRILPLYSHLYKLLYDGKINENLQMLVAGEVWMEDNPEYLAILVKLRGDMFTSDREINALALALDLKPL